jgi:cyclopropane fatty-acyl-phospholipid synthase-like methyltransferase
MHFTRFWSIVEANHDIQNPSTPQKLDYLIDSLQLTNTLSVLDVGCGKGWLLTRMAERCGITGTGIEINPWFCQAAVARAQRASVADRITIIESDAKAVELPAHHYDAAVCIGATFALGGLENCLQSLRHTVKPGCLIAVGDIFRYADQAPAEIAEYGDVPTLTELVDRVRGKHEPLNMIVANADDWDMYETRKWRAAHDWLARHASDPEHTELQQQFTQMRHSYLTVERTHIGWAIIVARNE